MQLMQPDHYEADWFVIIAVVIVICRSFGLCLRFGFGLWGLRKSTNKQTYPNRNVATKLK